jgi:hypothetical protein
VERIGTKVKRRRCPSGYPHARKCRSEEIVSTVKPDPIPAALAARLATKPVLVLSMSKWRSISARERDVDGWLDLGSLVQRTRRGNDDGRLG